MSTHPSAELFESRFVTNLFRPDFEDLLGLVREPARAKVLCKRGVHHHGSLFVLHGAVELVEEWRESERLHSSARDNARRRGESEVPQLAQHILSRHEMNSSRL
jgi:hypothetical protein